MSLSKLQVSTSLLLGAIFMCLPALYNRYPLWFEETSAYLEAATRADVSPSSNAIYASFIHHFSYLDSLWIVILIQGLLISLAIYYSFKYIFVSTQKWLFLFYTILASLCTAVSFHSSHIMPDIFTPIMILSAGVFLFATPSKQDKVVLAILFISATSMHNAQWGIMGLLLLLVGSKRLWGYFQKKASFTAIQTQGLVIVGLLTLTSYLLVSGVHYHLGGKFKPTRGEDFYLFARLSDYSLVQYYFASQDVVTSHPLLNSVWALKKGATYLWKDKEASLAKHGGWSKENQQFFEQFNQDVLASPDAYKRYLVKSFEQSIALLFNVDMEPLSNVVPDSMYFQAKRYSPRYGRTFYNARQRSENYAPETISAKNQLQAGCLLGAILILLACCYRPVPREQSTVTAFTVFLLFSLLVNAVITVLYWGNNAHFQSRVAWLLTLPAFWYCYQQWTTYNTQKINQASIKEAS